MLLDTLGRNRTTLIQRTSVVCTSTHQAVLQHWYGKERSGQAHHEGTSDAMLRCADCDVSPLLCSPFYGLGDSNLLVHMKVGEACGYIMGGLSRCPITWQWVGLHIYHPPWTRRICIPLDHGGSTVMPAFASTEEQMWTIMAYSGAEEGIKYSDDVSWNDISTVELVESEDCEMGRYYSKPKRVWFPSKRLLIPSTRWCINLVDSLP